MALMGNRLPQQLQSQILHAAAPPSNPGCVFQIALNMPLQSFLSKTERSAMKLRKRITSLLEMSDFFNSSQMLRFQNENEFRTLTGGIISIGIIITIIISFASMILDTLNLSTINYTENSLKRVDPSYTVMTADPDKNFMFAIEVWRQNLSAPIRYFDVISVFYYEEYGISTTIDMPLVQCTPHHWASMPELVNNFDKLEISGWLCPPIGSKYELFGKYSSEKYQQMAFQVYPCNNATDPSRPCAPQAEIDQMFADNGDYFYFTFYFINTVINPDNPIYKSYYLQDEAYVIFGKQLGTETRIYFSDYTINTDYSIWPFTNEVTDIGFMAESLNTQHPYAITQPGTAYVGMYINKDARSLIYERQVQKLSTVFSFMGGMIGAIMAVMFIVNAYTSFSYEISVAFAVFRQVKKKPQMDSDDGVERDSKEEEREEKEEEEKEKLLDKDSSPPITLWDFVKYNVYKICKKFSKKLDWPAMTHIYEARKQILCQLDIKSLIKRMIFLEYTLTYLFEDYQLEGMQINKPTSPKAIKLIRRKMDMVASVQDGLEDEEEESEDQNKTAKPLDDTKNGLGYSLQLATNRTKQKGQYPVQLSGNVLNTPKEPVKKKLHIMVETIKEIPALKELNEDNAIDVRERDFIRKRTTNICDLKMSADQGDAISRKIWRNLLAKREADRKQSKKSQEIPVEWIEKR